MHIPIHRQISLMKLNGLKVSKGTIFNGFKYLSQYLLPLYEQFRQESQKSLHHLADETRWKVFTEVEGKNSFLWWLWAFVSKNVVFYLVDKTRSSNEVERMLRNPVVGRKNYYSNHSVFGGQFSAMMFTFCQSCIMNGINPDAYLAYYLNECARIGGVP